MPLAGEFYNESELLHLLSKDDVDAFTSLFNHYRPKVYGVALKVLKSKPQAEDILHDVFLKIWLKRSDAPEIHRFEAYLMAMTRNFVFDSLKKKAYDATAKKELGYGMSLPNSTDHRVLEFQYQQLINEAVNLLPEQQRRIYGMVKQEGLSHNAVGKRLGITRLTVKKHMANALKFIRWYLQKNGGLILFGILCRLLQ